MKELSQIRHQLVIAAQKEYDRRIDKGIHPYSMASHQFDRVIIEKLREYIDISNWKADNWRALSASFDSSLYNEGEYDEGQWAVGAVLNSKEAWATPGFAEAYRFNAVHGS